MFGSPLRTTILITLLFGIGTGSALVWLTRPVQSEGPEVVKDEVTTQEGVPCWLTIRSAHPMTSVRVFRGSEELELDLFSDSEAEAELNIEGEATLKLIVRWAEDAPETAVMVRLEPEGQEGMERTIWAQRRLTEELTFTLDQDGGE